jgi:glycosyltransferase involved in cell wall biosynthesis
MEGFGRLTYETTKKLVENNPNDTFYLLFDRPHNDQFNFGPNVRPVVLFPPARHPILWYIWFEWSIYFALKKIKPDVFFSPDGYTCIGTSVKTLLMTHDISFIHYPKQIPFLVRKYYEYYTPRFLKRANRLITLTDYSLKDISSYYHIPQEKFALTTVAAHGLFRPVDAQTKQNTLNKYSQGHEYFLYVGAIHPRKNIHRLIAGFDSFKKASKSSFKLLIAGRFLFKTKEVLKAYDNSAYKKDIHFVGYLDQDLYAVTASAYALTYVSIYEGFGMPIVEAMNCHIPCITSNISSMPEVAGSTGILVNPLSIQEIADAMSKMVYDENLYASLQANCRKRKSQFSWEKTAEDVYNNLLELRS